MKAQETASVIPLRAKAPMRPEALDERVIMLDIDQIEPYEHNPRLLLNPKWQEIEASIVASGGLTEALSVTKRPSDNHYIVHQGGNTRLLILKKLHAETADDRFWRVRVELHPYSSELDLAVLHDRENTCRGNLTFIEQAWSKYRQFELYCQSGMGKPTALGFVEFLVETYGDHLTSDAFSRMKFAVEVLYQHIPTCLVQGGMSRKAVRRLILVRRALEKIWIDREIGTKADFEETFYGLLARQDKDLAETFVSGEHGPSRFPDARIEIDWQLLYEDMSHELTILVDIDHQRAGALLAPAFRSRVAPAARDDHDEFPEASAALVATKRPPVWDRPALASKRAVEHADHKRDPSDRPHPMTRSQRPSSTVLSVKPKLVQPTSIHELRTEARQLAERFASNEGLGEFIEATPARGYGYRVLDVPEGLRLSSQAKACWWALVLCSSRPDSTPSNAEMGAASISALAADHLSIWIKLLTVHAHLIDRHDDLWSRTSIV